MANCKKCGAEMRQVSSSRVVPKARPGGLGPSGSKAHPILAAMISAVKVANFIEENITKYYCDNCESGGLRVGQNHYIKAKDNLDRYR